MSDIIKKDPNKQSNTVLPAKEQIASTLDKRATPGLVALHEESRISDENVNETAYLTGIVLENIFPPNSDGKTKYRLPHLNMESGKYLEDFLVKVLILDESTFAALENPEDIFIKAAKLTSGAQAKFEFDKNNPEHIKIWKKYFSSMVQHVTLAPKKTSGLFDTPPAPGTQVRVYLFQPLQISSGHSISGLYEVEYGDIFNQGYSQMTEFFSGFRQKFIESINNLKKILQVGNGNLPSLLLQLAQGGTTVINTATSAFTTTQAAVVADPSQYLMSIEPGSANKEVVEAAFSYPDRAGGVYDLKGNGVLETIYHDGKVLLEYTNSTYCSGATFTVAMKVINNRKLLSGRTLKEMREFQRRWYGNPDAGGDPERQQGPALESMGIGGNINPLEAMPGDFAQIHWKSGNGHSVIFLEWIIEDDKKVGFKYRSSQGTPQKPSSGYQNSIAYFSDSGKTGALAVRERLYISRIKG